MNTINVENIPQELRGRDQWVRWRTETPAGRKPTKVPYDCNGGHHASSTDPATWASFTHAMASYEREQNKYDGVGFVFSAEDDFAGVDLDGCIQDGKWVPEAWEIILQLNSYAEFSPSGTGVKIFFRGTLPFTGKINNAVPFKQIECYSSGRYFTTTGQHVEGTPKTVEFRQEGIDWLVATYFKPPPARVVSNSSPPPAVIDPATAVDQCKNFILSCPDAISGNRGHDATLRAACECFRFGLSDADAVAVMNWFNENKTDEKWTQDELAKKLADAKKKVQDEGQIGSRLVAAWEEPAPLGELLIPDFPSDALGPDLGRYVEAVAESVQVPADIPGVLVLSVGGAALAHKYDVHVRSDHYEPLNIFTAAVADSGDRKSAVYREVTAPLTQYEIDQAEAMASEIDIAATERVITEKSIESLSTKASKATDPTEQRQLRDQINAAKEKLRQLPEVVAPQMTADDITQERIVGLMRVHGGRIAIMSPEGGVFEQMSGKYSKTAAPNLDVYLKAFSGDDIRVDRVGRAPEWVRSPALTLGLTVQPDVIRGLLSKPALRGRGLLARIFYAWPKSKVGYREIDPPAISQTVRQAYIRVVMAALRLPVVPPRSTAVRVGPEALDVLDTFATDIEVGLRRDGKLAGIRDWGAKGVGLVARIAGILHGLQHAGGGAPQAIAIDGDTMSRAVVIGHYATQHAIATFYEMGASPDIDMARRVLDWLKRERLATFSRRDAHRRFQSSVTTVDDMVAPLELLVRHGYIRREKQAKVSHRPSEAYETHPSIHRQ